MNKIVNMKNKWLFLMAGLFLISAVLPQEQVRIFMVGDSTMANKAAARHPETGWGQVFNRFFNNDVNIYNRAMNGRSTKSFMAEKRWSRVLDSLQKGDYVFVEFGHNDEKVNSPKIGTTLEEFRTNLIQYVTEARLKNAIPILLTPVERRIFKDGTLYDSHMGYPDVIRKVAEEYKVPLIDMHKKSRDYLIEIGSKGTVKLFLHADSGILVNYPKGIKDNTHFSEEGAKAMAGLAVEGIRELNLPLSKYLKP
jgi:lysophospholipase L1-like esterase